MNTVAPVVSVITPTYNRMHLLPRTWASLSRQTEQRFQWIVVDDGSTDQTRAFVTSLHDTRISYIYQNNAGQNVARQRGELEICAPLVVFLDSDDELYSGDTLNLMIDTIKNTPIDIGVVAFAVITPEGGGGHSRFAEDEMILGYEDLICGCKARGEAFRIFKREALKTTTWWTDGLGLLSLRYFEIAKNYRFLYLNQPALIYHMNHGGNLSSGEASIKRAKSMADGYIKLIENHRAGWLAACPSVYGAKLYNAAMYCAIDGQSTKAFLFAIQSMHYGGPIPNTLRLMVLLLLPLPWRQRIFIWRSKRHGIH